MEDIVHFSLSVNTVNAFVELSKSLMGNIRYFLNGINFKKDADSNTVRICGTNGQYLVRANEQTEFVSESFLETAFDFTIKSEALQSIVNFVRQDSKDFKNVSTVKFSVSTGVVNDKTAFIVVYRNFMDTVQLQLEVIDFRYPEVDRVIMPLVGVANAIADIRNSSIGWGATFNNEYLALASKFFKVYDGKRKFYNINIQTLGENLGAQLTCTDKSADDAVFILMPIA